MFLLLAEKKLESLPQIKNLIDENRIECQVVNCSSSKVLLDLAKKLTPQVIILDIEFILEGYEEKSDLIRILRQIKPDTYIITLVDSDNFHKLSKAIEKDINDYLFKPLQPEDTMLRVNIGLQRNNPKSELSLDDHETGHQQVELKSKNFLKKIEDTFTDEPEQILSESSEQSGKIEEVAISDYEEIDTLSELDQVQTEEDTLFEPEVIPDTTAGEEPYDTLDNNFDDELPRGTFDSTFNPDQDAKTDLKGFDEEATVEESFLNTFSDQQISAEKPEDLSEEEGPPETDPEGYIKDIETEDEYAPGEDVLEYYKGQLDNPVPDSETVDLPPKTETISAAEHELSVEELESKVNLQEEQIMQIDDSELFGTEYKKKPVDTRFFEELFDKSDESGKKKKNILSGRKAEQKTANLEGYTLDNDFPLFDKTEFKAAEPKESKEPLEPKEPDEPGDPEEPGDPGEQVKPLKHDNLFLRDEHKLIESPLPKKKKKEDKREKDKGNRFFKFTGNLIMVVLLLFLFTLSFFLIQSRISGDSPEIAGYKIFYVQSGSMKPAFNTGSVILVEPVNPLAIIEGDIITFSSSNDPASLTTHRVAGINRDGGLSFITRGDANTTNDPNPVQPDQLVGKVRGSVPYVGYLLSFVQTREGLILLIFVPGFLILVFELKKIFGYLAQDRAAKTTSKKRKDKTPEFDLGEKYSREALAGEDDIIQKML